MRRYKVTLRPEAQDDLQRIYDGVLDKNGAVAQRFVARILSRCKRMGDVAHGGRPRDDLYPGMRIVPFEHSAVITYVVTDKVEIMNIFFGGRDTMPSTGKSRRPTDLAIIKSP